MTRPPAIAPALEPDSTWLSYGGHKRLERVVDSVASGIMIGDLSGEVAVVLGGTSGIGRAIAHGLAEAGADVVPSSRRMARVESTACEIEERGRRTLRMDSDACKRDSLEKLLKATVESFGKVDILVNSFGRIQVAPTLEFSDDDWRAILEINLNGTLRACQVFGRHMIDRRYGRIINIASIGSFRALNHAAAYSASKAGVVALTKSLALEWRQYGVCVNAIMPGVFVTELNRKLLEGTARGKEFLLRTPMKRFGEVEELAGVAVYLASGLLTGEILRVDGGMLASGVNAVPSLPRD